MKINIISLINSPLRSRWMDSNYSIFNAHTKKDSSIIPFNPSLFRLFNGRQARQAEVGCAYSHLSLYKQIADDKAGDHQCILEDDALLETSFFNAIETIDKFKEKKPTIYVLGFVKTRKKEHLIRKLKYPLRSKIKFGKLVFGINDLNQCGAISYVINKSAAELIISQEQLFWLADDWMIYKRMGINVLFIEKPLVYEDLTTDSSTNNKVHSTENIFRYPFVNLYMILKAQIKELLRFIL